MELIIISGRSGSGKSVALRALEDIGYYCIDNLPLALFSQSIEILKNNQESKIQRLAKKISRSRSDQPRYPQYSGIASNAGASITTTAAEY